jgi:hypothetical protein
MKLATIFVIALSIMSASCVKDRITAAGSGPVNLGDRKLIHYYNFNTATDIAGLQRTDTTIGGSNITFNTTSTGYADTFSIGSSLNLRRTSDSGFCMRLRCKNWTIKLPTTGYKQPIFQIAVSRSNKGATTNSITYTTDGTNFTSNGLSAASINIDAVWTQYSLDFSTISAVDNNPTFAIRFSNNGDTTNGNNRYDNITLDALPQ